MRLELKNPEGSKTTTTTTNNDVTDTTKDTADTENGKKDEDFDIGPPLEVLFPYDRIYPEQYRFLQCVKRALHKKGHALIEAPPGTNQSLCLSALLTSYQQQQQQNQQQMTDSTHGTPQRKIIYATNSVPETLKVIRELTVAMEYRQQQDQQPQSNGNKKRKKRPQQHDALFQNVQDGFWKSTAAMAEEPQDATTAAKIQTYNEQHAHRDDALPFLAICLKGSDREMIDRACRNRKQGNENQSPSSSPSQAVHGIFTSLQHLHEWVLGTNANANGNSQWSCPHELTDYAIRHANVLVVTYPYLLDPMTAMMIGSAIYDGPQPHETSNSKETPSHDKTKPTTSETTNNESSSSSSSDAIVVFDHAHNIDAACNDALSATVHLHDLEQATRSLDKLSSEIARYKQQQQQKHGRRASETSTAMEIDTMDTAMEDATSIPKTPISTPLQSEYESLVQHPMDAGMYRPILFPSSDVVTEPVPGNIRHAKHFVGCLKKIVEHFKSRLKLATDEVSFKNQQQKQHQKEGGVKNKKKMSTGSQSPLAFLHQMMNATALDSKTLRFVHFRVVTLLRTLGLSQESFFAGLLNVAYLASLLGFTNTLESTKFAIVLEQSSVVIGHHSSPTIHNSTAAAIDAGRKTEYVMMLQVACLDPSLAMRPILDRFDTVILTSSTLSPLPFYPKILQFEPVVAESIPMTTIRPCINPIMISRGSDQLTMSTSYKERFTMGCIRNYGKMLVDLVSSIPDGVVVYFPSYNYMEALICEWDATGIMREMTEWKLVFVETQDNRELNAIALDNYRASCDMGRGGIFFSVARGSISEAVPFDLHYGRAVVMIGIPYEYTLSKVVQARLEYIQTHCDIREQDYLTFDAVRQVSKCFGRVVRSKTDYGVLIFADNRFHRNDKKTKLPGWVTQFLPESQQDLTTDSAVAQIQRFLRQTGQPVDQSLLQTVLTTHQDR